MKNFYQDQAEAGACVANSHFSVLTDAAMITVNLIEGT